MKAFSLPPRILLVSVSLELDVSGISQGDGEILLCTQYSFFLALLGSLFSLYHFVSSDRKCLGSNLMNNIRMTKVIIF